MGVFTKFYKFSIKYYGKFVDSYLYLKTLTHFSQCSQFIPPLPPPFPLENKRFSGVFREYKILKICDIIWGLRLCD